MVIFDSNVLITLITAEQNSLNYHKVLHLLDELKKSNTVVGIPAPSWAEFIVKTDQATFDAIALVKGQSNLKVLPFDEAAAHEAALILRGALATTGKKGHSEGNWQQIKFDRQILSTARVKNATAIYTDDIGLIKEANRVGLKTIQISEIQNSQVQNNLDF